MDAYGKYFLKLMMECLRYTFCGTNSISWSIALQRNLIRRWCLKNVSL